MSGPVRARVFAAALAAVAIIAIFGPSCTRETIPLPTPSPAPRVTAAVTPAPTPAPVAPARTPLSVPALPIPITPAPLPGQPVRPQEPELLLVVRAFFLEINAPADKSIIRSNSVKVEGRTLPGSVVTLNGRIAAVDSRGRFSVPVQLEEGPNTIELIASDFLGNQGFHVITVIRLPS